MPWGVLVEHTHGKICIFCVYGPNGTDEKFFSDLDKKLETLDKNAMVVVGGDWNLVLSNLPLAANPDLIDCQSVPNEANAAVVRDLIARNSLEDMYRMENPNGGAYTYKHFSGRRPAKSRLDFFLTYSIGADPRRPRFKSRILPKLCTSFDHRAVLLELKKKSYEEVARGRTRGTPRTLNLHTITKEALEIIFASNTIQLMDDHLRSVEVHDPDIRGIAGALAGKATRKFR